MIVTFYSYKGGVGRSMALANVGEYLARQGISVIMIDWDLEAPGLERYFPVSREEVEARLGVIDLLIEYREAMAQPPPPDVAKSSTGMAQPPDTEEADQNNHIGQRFGFHSPREYLLDLGEKLGLPAGRLSLLPAGQRDGERFASYAARVQGLDWAAFYRDWEGEVYLEWFRKELDADDALVLVDSRTGVTEIGGVCVYQLADVVVMLCAANQVNIEGTQQMAAAFNRPEVESLRGGRKLRILPVPARIPKVEEVREINNFLNNFALVMGQYYRSLGLDPEASARRFLIPQIPLYSFRERVAVRETGHSPYRNDDLTKVYSELAYTLARLAEPGSALARFGASAAPPLHNLPYPPLGDLFAGRQADLDALAGGKTAAITQSTVISGLGGIGKTRLAVEYAWRCGHRYTAAWFVRADSPESLHRNLAALAGPELLNLPEWKAKEEKETVGAVLRWLREHAGWLIILDNVDTPEASAAVLEILPSLLEGRILITSRLTTWPASVRKRSLGTLSREEAARFLLQRTEEGRTRAADDDRQAAVLAEALDGLPLALEQAAAFILRRRMRLADYLRVWEQERSVVLKWHDSRVMEYPASIAITWEQTFHRLSPTAAALLRLMAFLAPDPFPVNMFEKAPEVVEQAAQRLCEEVGKEPDGLSVQAALAELADYSMIALQDEGMVTVHRIVQEVLRSHIPVVKDWIEGTLRIVSGSAVGDTSDVRTWPVWDRLRPHVAAVVARADEEGIVQPTSRLLSDLGVLLWAKGLYSEAEPLMRRALALDETAFGNEHPNVAVRLKNLAALLKATNRLGEAEPLMRRALAIDEAASGKDHPDVAIDLNNLAQLLQDTNRLEEAEPLMRRALAIDEAVFGNEHPRIAVQLNNLAQFLQATNHLDEAEPLMRRALVIDEAFFGNEHPKIAIRLNNLAQLLQETNRLEEAEPLMRRALAIAESAFGSEHPTVAIRLNNLAQLLQDTGRLEEVEPLMRRALAIDEASFGSKHPDVARDLNNLAWLLQATNRLGEAETLMRRAVAILEQSPGADHPMTQVGRRNLELLSTEMGQDAQEGK